MTRATVRSVRDFPVTAVWHGTLITVTVRLARRPVMVFDLSYNVWCDPPGDCIGNPDYDRREMVRAAMARHGADFTGDAGCQNERIADAIITAIQKAII